MGTGFNQYGERCEKCSVPGARVRREVCDCSGRARIAGNADYVRPQAEVVRPADPDFFIEQMEVRFINVMADPARWGKAATVATAAVAAATTWATGGVDISSPAGFMFAAATAAGGMFLADRWQKGDEHHRNRETVRDALGPDVKDDEVDTWAVVTREPLTLGTSGETGDLSHYHGTYALKCERADDSTWAWEGKHRSTSGETVEVTGTSESPLRARSAFLTEAEARRRDSDMEHLNREHAEKEAAEREAAEKQARAEATAQEMEDFATGNYLDSAGGFAAVNPSTPPTS